MEKLDLNKKNKTLEFLQKNHVWVFTGLTIFGVVATGILSFLEYIKANIYFSHYGLDINLYEYNDKNVIFGLCLSIINLLLILSVSYCVFQTCNNIKNKIKFKCNDSLNILIVLIFNIIYILIDNSQFNFVAWLLEFIILVVMELISGNIIFKKIEKTELKDENVKNNLPNLLKLLPILLAILILLTQILFELPLFTIKQYRIVNDDKVIVYTGDKYYLTLDCEVSNSEIIIYKGSQEKISNDNVNSTLKLFSKVKLK